MLVEDPYREVLTAVRAPGWRWSSTRNIVRPPGPAPGPPRHHRCGNAASFAFYIAHGYFEYVALNFTDTPR